MFILFLFLFWGMITNGVHHSLQEILNVEGAQFCDATCPLTLLAIQTTIVLFLVKFVPGIGLHDTVSGLPVLASVALGIVKLSIGSVAMISASGQPEKTAFGGSVTEKRTMF